MPAVSTTAAPINLTVDRIETGSGGTLVYDRLAKFTEGKVDITAMRIVNQYKFAANKAVSSLEIEYKDKVKRTYKRTMPVIFIVDSTNKIVTCSGSTVIIERATIQTACEVASEGTMRYNEALGKCEKYPTVDFIGSQDYAQCDSGFWVVDCSHTPTTYIVPTVPAQFKKKGSQPMDVGAFSADRNTGTNSCDCDYTQDFLIADPNVRYVAKCTQATQ